MAPRKGFKDGGIPPEEALRQAIQDGVILEPAAGKDGPYICTVCQSELKNKSTIKGHIRSQKHIGNAQGAVPKATTNMRAKEVKDAVSSVQYGAVGGHEAEDEVDDVDELELAIQDGIVIEPKKEGLPYHCTTCNRDLKTRTTIRNHLDSKTHKKQVSGPLEADGTRIGETSGEDSESSLSETDEDYEVEMAFKDKILLESDYDDDAPFWCTICYQPLRIYGKLKYHLSSIKHTTKVEERSSPPGQRSRPVPRALVAGPKQPMERDSPRLLEYRYDSSVKGPVHVFNVLHERPGAEADSINIQNTFRKLGYTVNLHEDFTKEELLMDVAAIQKDNSLKKAGALILFILCHGINRNTFRTKDEKSVNLDSITGHFTEKECPNLKGKPKIIFANFCRGEDIEIDGNDNVKPKGSEVLVDTIIVHASNEGKRALRSKEYGTVFVGSLCGILKSNSKSKLLRHVYLELYKEMKKKRGTTPMAIDHVFKDFTFE